MSMNLMRFVFWNANKRDFTQSLCALANSTKADVIILNENSVQSCKTLDALRKDVTPDFFVPATMSEKRFHCFCRCRQLDMSEVHSGVRNSVRLWRLGADKALLALVHGVDMRNYDSETRQAFAQSLADEIRFVRKEQNTKKVVMIATDTESMIQKTSGHEGFLWSGCFGEHPVKPDCPLFFNPLSTH